MSRLALCVFFLVCAAVHAGPEESTVLVSWTRFVDRPDGVQQRQGGDGSGTVVRNDGRVSWVLTNRHIVTPTDGAFAFVRLRDNRMFVAQEIVADDKADLALVRVDADLGPAAKLADAEPKVGDLLRQWGHPHSGPAKPKAGKVIETAADLTVVGYQSEPGDSGSGVFDGDRLAGVCRLSFPRRPGTAGCVPLADVKRFVEKAAR